MPGLQVSNIFIANNQLRETFRKQVNAIGYSQLNIMGIVGCKIAYEKGGEWHKQVLAYLKRNLEFATEFMKQRIPSLSIIRPEGTYLLWIDFRGLELSKEERQDLIVNKAKLWLDRGDMFGKSGEGFERINIACPRAILSGALEQLAIAIKNLENKK